MTKPRWYVIEISVTYQGLVAIDHYNSAILINIEDIQLRVPTSK